MNFFNLLGSEAIDWFNWVIQGIPGRSGRLIRRVCFKTFLKKSGLNLSISNNVEIACPKNIMVGNNVSFLSGGVLRACDRAQLTIGNNFSANGNVRIIADCGGKIVIGNNVMIGPNTVMRSSNHIYSDLDMPMNMQGHAAGHILIEDDVWIAANVVILPNVKIGAHSIVAAGAVVSKDIPGYSIVAGVPAKIIASRLDS